MNIIAMLLIGIGLHELFSKDENKTAQNLQETPENDSIEVESNIDVKATIINSEKEKTDDSTDTDGNNRRSCLRQDDKEIPVNPETLQNADLSTLTKKEN